MVRKKKGVKKKRGSNGSFNRNLIIGVVILVVIFLLLMNFTGYDEEEGLALVYDGFLGDIIREPFDDSGLSPGARDAPLSEGIFQDGAS